MDMKTILAGASFIAAVSLAGAVHAQTEATGVDPPTSEQVGTGDFSVSSAKTENPPDKQKDRDTARELPRLVAIKLETCS